MTTARTFTRAAPMALVLALSVTGCASSHGVGSGVRIAKGGQQNLNVNGTPTKAPVVKKTTAKQIVKHKPTVTPTHVVVQKTAAPVVHTTTAPPVTKTQAPAAPTAFMVAINPDNSGSSTLNPPDISVYTGTPITWTNKDTVARSVKATNGAFTSPMIAPGKTYTWTPTTAGMVAYEDGTRPYVQGQIQVTAR